ncbi:SID1 transmembrane family member 1 [Eumeta japonica]|uniref:SID1 transmembrane family member 1 n=1 Tax=Eumeta variegata TaxID=151549 RepID=A0A4C1WTD8_EUMVA|nr:SID1 transmembrane family member 1 [Eumeta japonica]
MTLSRRVGVLGGGALFWGLFTVLHIFTFLMLSLRIYYVGQFRFEKDRIQTAAREIVSIPKSRPLYLARMIMLLLANCANWLLALYGFVTSSFAFTVLASLGRGGRVVPALYFFTYGSSDWSTTAAQSRARNHRCKLLEFYDSHDLWHLLSAIALYLTFCAMLTWDDGLAAVKRTDIAVF